MKYTPFGETRPGYLSGSVPTDRHFTGQREENGLGSLYDYNARMYSPVLGRFISADTMIPDAKNPQQFNRYAYTLNNPLRYIDPTGHLTEDELRQLLGNDYDALMKLWRTYDSYWMSVLEALKPGGTLWASMNGGLELHIESGDHGLFATAYNGESSWLTSIIFWQGQGAYQVRNLGMNNNQVSYLADDLFDSNEGVGNMLAEPVFEYGFDDNGHVNYKYLGARMVNQKVNQEIHAASFLGTVFGNTNTSNFVAA